MKKIYLVACLAILGFSSLQAQLNLTILHNNDGESKLVNAGTGLEDFGGIDRFKTLTDTLRAQSAAASFEVVMLSSGDNYLAGPQFNASLFRGGGRPYYDAVGIAGLDYDAICLGNHDFDFGPGVLANLINDVKGLNQTPFLSANLDFQNEPGLDSLANSGDIATRTTVMRNGQMIGIVGATTTSLRNISSPGNTIIDIDVVGAIQREVDSLTANGVDIIILISHLQGIEEDTSIIPMLQNIDVVIAGGGDELLGSAGDLVVPSDTAGGRTFGGPYPLMKEDMNGDTVYVVTTPGEYKYVGMLQVTFDANGEITAVGPNSGLKRVAAISETEGVLPDPIFKSTIVDSVNDYIAGLAANVIAQSQVALDGLRNSVRAIETNLGNMCADAMLWQANKVAGNFGAPQSDIGLVGGGGIRNNNILPAGDFTELMTFDILPFSNFVAVVEDITPDRFKEMMENSVSVVFNGGNGGSGRFGQIGGFSFVYDTTAQSLVYDPNTDTLITAGQRIWNLTLDNGTKIVENGVVNGSAGNVNLALPDFTAKGGDQYPLSDLTFTTVGVTYQQALFNYVTAADGLNALIDSADYPEGGEGRITYKDLSSGIETLVEESITVYPNPASNYVSVELTDPSARFTAFNVYNMAGEQVEGMTVEPSYKITILKGDLATGSYIVELINEEGLRLHKKVIFK